MMQVNAFGLTVKEPEPAAGSEIFFSARGRVEEDGTVTVVEVDVTRGDGALGYSDDELSGTARDAPAEPEQEVEQPVSDHGKRTLLVDGVPLTYERAIELGVDPAQLGAQADVYEDVPEQWAAQIAEALLRTHGELKIEVVIPSA